MPETRPLRRLFVPVFLPAAVFGIGQGASAPIVALQARELGASVGVAGLIVAVLGLGQVLGDLPAGRIVARIGERNAVLLGSAVGAAGVALSLVAWTPVLLGIGVGLFGVASAVWGLARQSYIVDTVPPGLRARALSAMAGLTRLGFLLGPFLGAGVVHLMGTRGGFVVQLVAVLAAGVLMGVANGLSNGLIMTIGADAAPDEGRTEFLGAFRLCHDLGTLAGPLVIGAVSAAAGLAVAAAALGGISGAGAGGMWRWLRRSRPAGQSSDSVPDSARPSAK